jgi:hypothetical protein
MPLDATGPDYAELERKRTRNQAIELTILQSEGEQMSKT